MLLGVVATPRIHKWCHLATAAATTAAATATPSAARAPQPAAAHPSATPATASIPRGTTLGRYGRVPERLWFIRGIWIPTASSTLPRARCLRERRRQRRHRLPRARGWEPCSSRLPAGLWSLVMKVPQQIGRWVRPSERPTEINSPDKMPLGLYPRAPCLNFGAPSHILSLIIRYVLALKCRDLFYLSQLFLNPSIKTIFFLPLIGLWSQLQS